MPDVFLVALVGGAIVIAAVAFLANVLQLRAFDKKFGKPSSRAAEGTGKRV